MSSCVSLVVSHNKRELRVELPPEATLADLRDRLHALTHVQPHNQRLIGIPPTAKPDAKLADLNISAKKLMLVGTPSAALAAAAAGEAAGMASAEAVVDDLDIDPDALQPVHQNPEYIAKIHARIRQYKPLELSPPRPSKRLLVLDVDYTLFDHRSPAEHPNQLARPFLHEFLAGAYTHYDIIIWSATSMRWVELKMRELGVLSSPAYKVVALFCHAAMITVQAEKYGVLDVKPLGVIWGLYPQYSAANTIMFDDLSRNFLMNPKCGLKIRPCRGMTVQHNRERDVELPRLGRYLSLIAALPDFSGLEHRAWEAYLAHHDAP